MNARVDASAFGRVDGPEHAIAEMEVMKRIWIREQCESDPTRMGPSRTHQTHTTLHSYNTADANQLKTLCKSVRRDIARLRRQTVRYGRPASGSEEEHDLFKRLGRSYASIARLIRELRM